MSSLPSLSADVHFIETEHEPAQVGELHTNSPLARTSDGRIGRRIIRCGNDEWRHRFGS